MTEHKLDTEREAQITIDAERLISVWPTTDGQSVVLSVEDPHSVVVVEIPIPEVDALVEALQGASR